jgi:glycosyltransferase involved in cell wall biosynthesis
VLLVLPGAETGGVQRHVEDLATGMTARGVEVTVTVGSQGPLCDRLERARIACVVVPMGSRRDRAPAVSALRALVRAVGADVVHTHGPLAGLFGREAAAREGRPFVHTMHGRGIADEMGGARFPLPWARLLHYRAWDRRWNARSATVICVSGSTAEAVGAAGDAPRDRIVTILNGIDADAYTRGRDRREEWGWPRHARVVSFVGRLAPQKDPLSFVACATHIARAQPNARFLLVGDGPLRAQVDAAVDRAGLRALCVLAGDRDDVPDVLATTDVLVIPSVYEGLPLIVLEAFAARCPVVAAAVRGLTDVVEHETTGLLVPRDVAAYAEAACRVLDDRALASALAERAHVVVRERYSRERMLADTLAVYRSAAGGAVSPAA